MATLIDTVRSNPAQQERFSFAAPASQQVSSSGLSLIPGLIGLMIAVVAYWTSSIWLLCTAVIPFLWMGLASPVRLVEMLLFTTPVFPVIRFVQEAVQARRVSTKGLFLSVDDPLIAALVVVWAIRVFQKTRVARELFPSALLWLAILYPSVIAINATRLDFGEVTVSALYYLKWLQYAMLVFAIPQMVPSAQVPRLLANSRRVVTLVICLSASFATYEVAESFRTGTYSANALFPRASAFFGTLDPLRFGASEDPVNFGVYAMVAGSIAIGLFSTKARAGGALTLAGIIASALALLLSASRAPILSAALALGKIQKLRPAHVMALVLLVALGGLVTVAVFPEMLTITMERFEAIGDFQGASENSASDRLMIALNSPVFEVDQYWLVGHGFFSYRFVAEEHLARLTNGVSRSLYNFLLTAWYDAGPAGLVLWLAVFVQINRRLSMASTTSPSDHVRSLATGLRGALWGLTLASMFGEVPYAWRVMGFFYTCLGICLAGDFHYRRQIPVRTVRA